jgi:peptidoglycan/LPS O-acetylase OafA/YrhL
MINSLQVLRAYAAIIVVLTHSLSQVSSVYSGLSFPFYIKEFLSSGVDVFFVISGFIMFYTSQAQGLYTQKNGWRRFIKKRALRIYPLYWLMLVAYLSLFFVKDVIQGGSEFFSRLEGDFHAIKSFILLPSINNQGNYLPILSVGWTLIFEMFFYVIFTAVLFLSSSTIMAAFLLIVFFAALLCFRVVFGDLGNAYVFYFTHSIVLEFLFGGLVAVYFQYCKVPNTSVCVVIFLMAIGLFSLTAFYGIYGGYSTFSSWRFLCWGGPSALLLFSVVGLERRLKPVIPAWLVEQGGSSYALYLSHAAITLPVLAFLLGRVPGLLPQGAGWVVFVLVVLVANAVALFLYKVVEPRLARISKLCLNRIFAEARKVLRVYKEL